MKKILLVGPYPPPYGGIATHIVGLAPYLAEQGYLVTILSLTYGKNETFSPSPGIEVLRVSASTLVWNVGALKTVFGAGHKYRLSNLEWLARELFITSFVRRIIEERGISLVISYMITSSLFVPHLRRVFGEKVKFATTIFGELVEKKEFILNNKRFYQKILLDSDHVLATSKYCAGLAQIVGYDPASIEIIYIGVDINQFLNSSKKGNPKNSILPADKRSILFVGRFHEEMGLDVVMESIPHVLSKKSDVCFVLVGGKGPLSHTAAKLREVYPDRVFIHQDAPFHALPSYYERAAILLAPTKDMHACMGVSIKEAMIAGKAIITTNSGGVPEAVVDGESGIVLNLDGREKIAEEKLTEAIIHLLDHPDLTLELGRRAKQRALEMFDNQISLRKHLAVIERLIGKPV